MCGWKVPDPGVSAQAVDRRRWLCQAACVSSLALHPKRFQAGRAGGDAFFRQLKSLDDPPTGPPGADNLMTNEDSIAAVVDQFVAEAPRGHVFIGVGPDQNYSLMAALGPGSAYIVDYRKKNQLLHLYHKAIMEFSQTRDAYLENFWARRATVENETIGERIRTLARQPLDKQRLGELQQKVRAMIAQWNFLNETQVEEILRIQARLAGPGPEARFLALKMYPTIGSLILSRTRSGQPAHWLATEEKYQLVRNLSLGDRIYPIVGDWAGTGCLPRLAEKLASDRLQVGAVYISDVEFFLMRGGLFSKYVANLARLPLHPHAVIIRTSTREIDHPQRVGGQSSTTIVRPLKRFLESARAGKMERWEELFKV